MAESLKQYFEDHKKSSKLWSSGTGTYPHGRDGNIDIPRKNLLHALINSPIVILNGILEAVHLIFSKTPQNSDVGRIDNVDSDTDDEENVQENLQNHYENTKSTNNGKYLERTELDAHMKGSRSGPSKYKENLQYDLEEFKIRKAFVKLMKLQTTEKTSKIKDYNISSQRSEDSIIEIMPCYVKLERCDHLVNKIERPKRLIERRSLRSN